MNLKSYNFIPNINAKTPNLTNIIKNQIKLFILRILFDVVISDLI